MAVAALWLLARIRFQDLPVTANPIPSVLSQLASGPRYDDLAAEIAQVQARVQPFLHALAGPAAPGSPEPRRTAAIRFREDLVVTLVADGTDPEQWSDAIVVARDPATALAVVRIPDAAAMSLPEPWTPRRLQQARYLLASDISGVGVSLRPAFVGSLDPIDSAMWPERVWGVPGNTGLTAGSFLFTPNAELVGMVVTHGARLAVVPGATVLAEAERLLATPPGPGGTLGVEVQDLTQPVASLTGAPAGVVVTWVDKDGPARGQLVVGDVIEAVDGQPLEARQHWDVRALRASVGEVLTLRVRRRGELREVPLTASAAAARPASRALGLTLRERPRIGAEVVRVDPSSAAERSGLRAGDVITLVADLPAPTPGQLTRSFAAIGPGQRVLVGFTRGAAHHVTTLER